MKAKPISISNVSLDNNELQKVTETCCLGCVFAEGEFRGDSEKGTLHFIQEHLGCSMSVLNEYRTQGEELQESIDKDNNEFYVVRGRVCPFYRPKYWELNPKDINDDIGTRVRKEVTLQPDIVIYFDDTMQSTDLLDTIEALKQSEIPPARLYIANNSNMRPSQIMLLMAECPFQWRAETMLEGKCSIFRSIDIATKKCTNIFVTYFEAGYKPQPDFFTKIDIALYDELDKFVCLEPLPDSINGLTVLRIFTKQADGNARSPIWEKAKKISEEQKCQYLVRPVTEILNR